MKVMRIAVLIVTLTAMLAIWPFCVILRDTEKRSGDVSHECLEPLEVGESIVQSFQPAAKRIDSLDVVFYYEEGTPRKGEILFELLDEEGQILQQTSLQYEWIPGYRYFNIYVGKKLDTSKIYQYRITNVSVTENLPVLMYTKDPEMYSGVSCGLEVNGEPAEGELLTRYQWKQSLTVRNIIALWAVFALAASMAWELLNLWSQAVKKRVEGAGK